MSSSFYVAVLKAASHFPIAIPHYWSLGLGCTFFFFFPPWAIAWQTAWKIFLFLFLPFPNWDSGPQHLGSMLIAPQTAKSCAEVL